MGLVVNRSGPTNTDLIRRRTEKCWHCGEPKSMTTLDSNNKPTCVDCLPERYRANFAQEPETTDGSPAASAE